MSEPTGITFHTLQVGKTNFYYCDIDLQYTTAVDKFLTTHGNNIVFCGKDPYDKFKSFRGPSVRSSCGLFKLLHEDRLYKLTFKKRTFSGSKIAYDHNNEHVVLETKNMSENIIEKIKKEKPRLADHYIPWRNMVTTSDMNGARICEFLKNNIFKIIKRSAKHIESEKGYREICIMVYGIKENHIEIPGYKTKYRNSKFYTNDERKQYRSTHDGNGPPKYLDRIYPILTVKCLWYKTHKQNMYNKPKFRKRIIPSETKKNNPYQITLSPIEIDPEDELQVLRKNIHPFGKVELTFDMGLQIEGGRIFINHNFCNYTYYNVKHMKLSMNIEQKGEEVLYIDYDDYSDDSDDKQIDPYKRFNRHKNYNTTNRDIGSAQEKTTSSRKSSTKKSKNLSAKSHTNSSIGITTTTVAISSSFK